MTKITRHTDGLPTGHDGRTLNAMWHGDAIDARAMLAVEVCKERAHRGAGAPLEHADRADVETLRRSVEYFNGEPLL